MGSHQQAVRASSGKTKLMAATPPFKQSMPAPLVSLPTHHPSISTAEHRSPGTWPPGSPEWRAARRPRPPLRSSRSTQACGNWRVQAVHTVQGGCCVPALPWAQNVFQFKHLTRDKHASPWRASLLCRPLMRRLDAHTGERAGQALRLLLQQALEHALQVLCQVACCGIPVVAIKHACSGKEAPRLGAVRANGGGQEVAGAAVPTSQPAAARALPGLSFRAATFEPSVPTRIQPAAYGLHDHMVLLCVPGALVGGLPVRELSCFVRVVGGCSARCGDQRTCGRPPGVSAETPKGAVDASLAPALPGGAPGHCQ